MCVFFTNAGGSTIDKRVVNQLTALLDDMQGHHVVIAATNRITDVDRLLRRPGRLEKEVIIQLYIGDAFSQN